MTLSQFIESPLEFAWIEVDGKPVYVKRVDTMLEVGTEKQARKPRVSPFSALVFTEVARALGGRPNDLTEDEIGKLSPRAQEQLYRALHKLQQDVSGPISNLRLMREVARGRVAFPGSQKDPLK